MSKQDDPEWEIVDSLPQKRKGSKQRIRLRIPKKLIIGAGVGLALIILFPPARLFLHHLVRNVIAYWWILVAMAGYWFLKRQFKR